MQNGSVTLLSEEAGSIFLAPVTVGGQNFEVIIDTGSSDPWLAIPNFQCVNLYTGAIQDESQCYFGPLYNKSASSTFVTLPQRNMNITYSDGETLTGLMGYDSFTMGGITVPEQQFGLVDYAAWYGDGVSSGLIGFAYGTITSAYYGTDPTQDQTGRTIMYKALFENMYNMSLVAPVFSMAINRDASNGGVLALGGIPNIPHSSSWVSTPIISVGVFAGTTTPAYEFYSIFADGIAFSTSASAQFDVYGTGNPHKTPLTSNLTLIIDSGTSLMYLPNGVADQVAAGFLPPATYNDNTGSYEVDCAATPPLFGVSIAKKIFFVNPADMIIRTSQTTCISSVLPNNGGLSILGDAWMKNVLCVFDIGAELMRFSAREFYGLTSIAIRPST